MFYIGIIKSNEGAESGIILFYMLDFYIGKVNVIVVIFIKSVGENNSFFIFC